MSSDSKHGFLRLVDALADEPDESHAEVADEGAAPAVPDATTPDVGGDEAASEPGRGMVLSHADPEVAMREALERDGWFAFRSAVLGEVVVAVRDEAALGRVPATLEGAARYSTRELAELGGVDARDLGVLHSFKKLFGGRMTVAGPADHQE